MFKRLKASNRGLTFSMTENNIFQIGCRYRYILDKGNKRIIIFPSDDHGNTVSRKCYGNRELPLIDIRSKEIRDIVSKANYLEVELLTDSLVIHVFVTDKDMGTELPDDEVPVVSFIIPDSALDLSEYDTVLGELLREQGLLKTDVSIRKDIKRIFSVISLFSGCGALDYPFYKDDCFQIVFANEINQAAAASYRNNIHEDVCGMDIRDITEGIPLADGLIAGIPCTPYTDVNRSEKRLQNHKDYGLLSQYLRFVQEAHPKVFAIENVPTFISKHTDCQSQIKEKVPEYQLSYRVVCDSFLGGFTYRKRLILFGSRIGKIDIPDIEVFPKRTVYEALKKVKPDWYNYSDVTMPSVSTKERMKYVPQGGNYKNMPVEMRNGSVHSNIFRRLHPDFPACALPNWRKTNILHTEEDRILTVGEASSLMGNGSSFHYLGTLSERQQQCANSVPQSIAVFTKALMKYALVKNLMNNFTEVLQ